MYNVGVVPGFLSGFCIIKGPRIPNPKRGGPRIPNPGIMNEFSNTTRFYIDKSLNRYLKNAVQTKKYVL